MLISADDPHGAADLLAMADEVAADAAAFLGAVEAVAAGTNPGAAVSVLLLGVSGILSSGAALGAQEDILGTDEPVVSRATDQDVQAAGRLRSALAEQFGAVNEYREVVDPYVGDEVDTFFLSDELANICGDLMHGLALYTDGSVREALAWWQATYLSSWGPAASSCLRAVQSLMALVRLGSAMGSPGDDVPVEAR